MSESENQNPRYMITYRENSNIFEIIKYLNEQCAEIYLHVPTRRQIGARISEDKLETITKTVWVEEIADD